jgi:hypothetical protein
MKKASVIIITLLLLLIISAITFDSAKTPSSNREGMKDNQFTIEEIASNK